MPKLIGERLIHKEKIVEYLLNPDHAGGGAGKARFFMSFGFSREEPTLFGAALHAHTELHDVEIETASAFGTKSVVRCSLRSPDGRDPCIVSVWIRDGSSGEQRLATAYPG